MCSGCLFLYLDGRSAPVPQEPELRDALVGIFFSGLVR